tara:strand:+ start:159 stop:533 length:375 start_codon:yes stop_codon:yes gene_type:complete
MKIAETFECQIVDEYGGVYPNAYVAILDGHEYLNRGFSAEAPGSEYVFDTTIDGASYMVMYWYTKENVGKFKSRPLRIADGAGFTNVVEVDMDHAEALEIMARPLHQDDRLLKLIKSDLIRRFS